MCGIAGIVGGPPQELEPLARRMADAQRHRGPDDWGTWRDDQCALAHRRLSIIDLSEAGRQPLSNEDGTVWITFNGEIYNFADLRAELAQLGHTFRTRTDTEAIVHAYEQWGTDCVRRLRGMFAFAIWDQNRRRLFVARDRAGKKPLFYTQAGDRFLFASELQGLLADSELSRTPDLQAIDEYLSWGYIPAPQTGFQGISKLPPAHWMTVDTSHDDPVVRVERYWSLSYGPKLRISEAEACEALRDKLTEAVRLRLVSDVPLGAFLSGGIDSSVVVGLMAGLSDQPVKTFSIGFQEAAFNELPHARRIAERWSTDHHELVVEPDALAILPTLVRHYGEPYADSSAIPTFYVSQITRRYVTVALNGDGGDESFAGYERYLGNRLAQRLHAIPGSRAAATLLAKLLPDSVNPKSRLRQAQRFLSVATEPIGDRYSRWIGFFSPEEKDSLYTPQAQNSVTARASSTWLATLFDQQRDLDPVDASMAVDVLSYLPYDLLVKVDITSMANSLEARSPLLDHEVMEFAARLPVSYKLNGTRSKHLIKRAFPDLLPPENVSRRKMGFGVPVGHWFRTALKDLLCDSLLGDRSLSRGYFRREALERLVQDHVQGRSERSAQLWNLLMLELWHQEFIDRTSAPLQAVVA